LIAAKYPGWKIVFAGNGEIESGKVLAKELNIEQQVEFAGWISGSRKDEVFTNASIFCLPSYAEGFPMAVLDAMSFSLPVIATPVGGTTDVFKDDYHLLIFKPGDINELADKLQRLIDSDELKDRLVANSSIVLRENFTLPKITEKVDALYQSLVTG
jgi:glycosyltransferase involved in cell wall biosynthesis